jgi:DNA helicase-2/ATP-dependent DNA helicase PcrA
MTNEIQAQEYLALRRTIMEKRLGSLNGRQREAALVTQGPLLILAGAGSGKTTVLIHRIAQVLLFGGAYQSDTVPFYITQDDMDYLQRQCAAASPGMAVEERLRRLLCEYPPRPWEILAVTFTNKAAAELRARLCAMVGEEQARDVTAATFHSFCVRILRAEIESLGYRRDFTIYDADDARRVVKDAVGELGLDEKMFAPRGVLAQIGKAKDMLETPAQTIERARLASDYRLTKTGQIYERYQSRLRAANALDFDDIITLTVRLFEENPSVLKKYQSRYRYIMVDEYQDTNQSQYRLVSMLAQGYGNLCVVGDDDQSIYRFRGATIENILSFEAQFPGTKTIRLEQNYRSTQNILDAANASSPTTRPEKAKRSGRTRARAQSFCCSPRPTSARRRPSSPTSCGPRTARAGRGPTMSYCTALTPSRIR